MTRQTPAASLTGQKSLLQRWIKSLGENSKGQKKNNTGRLLTQVRLWLGPRREHLSSKKKTRTKTRARIKIKIKTRTKARTKTRTKTVTGYLHFEDL